MLGYTPLLLRTVKFKQILSAKSNPIKAFLKIKQKNIFYINKTRPKLNPWTTVPAGNIHWFKRLLLQKLL